MFSRDEAGEWIYAFLDASGVLDMPEADIAIPLAEIYEGVELTA